MWLAKLSDSRLKVSDSALPPLRCSDTRPERASAPCMLSAARTSGTGMSSSTDSSWYNLFKGSRPRRSAVSLSMRSFSNNTTNARIWPSLADKPTSADKRATLRCRHSGHTAVARLRSLSTCSWRSLTRAFGMLDTWLSSLMKSSMPRN